MKKVLFSLVLVLALFTSCADSKVIDGVRYRPYFNKQRQVRSLLILDSNKQIAKVFISSVG